MKEDFPSVDRITVSGVLTQQHHLRAAEQSHLSAGRLVCDDCIPHLRLSAYVGRFTAADDAVAHTSRRQEVRLQLHRRERRAVGDVGATANRCARIGQRHDGGRKQEPRSCNEILGDVDVADDEVARGVIEDAAKLSRYTLGEKRRHFDRSRYGIPGLGGFHHARNGSLPIAAVRTRFVQSAFGEASRRREHAARE